MTAGIIDLNEFLEDIRLPLPRYSDPGVLFRIIMLAIGQN